MTVADVEVRHSRNLRTSQNRHCNVSFESMATHYVSTEFADLKRSAVRAAAEAQEAGKAGSGGVDEDLALALAREPAGELGDAGGPRRASASGRRRGKRALDFFAADHDLNDYLEKGKKTTRYWKKLKEDLAALPEERQVWYASKAQQSHLEAKEAEVQAKAKAEAAHSLDVTDMPHRSGSGAPGAIAVRANRDALAMNIAQPDSLPCASEVEQVSDTAAGNLVAHMRECEASIPEVARAYADGDDLAIVRQLVDINSFGQFVQCANVHMTAEKWIASTRRIGAPIAGETFPEKVVYPHHCRCVCERNIAAHAKAMGLLRMFSDAASHCKTPAGVPGSDMLIVAAAKRPSTEEPHVTYWWMACASFRSGNHEPTHTLIKCSTIDTSIGPSGPRIHLCVEREQFVVMNGEVRSPFEQQAASPAFYSEEAAARLILFGRAGEGFSTELPSEVTFDKQCVVEQHGDAILATGSQWKI